MRAATRRLLHAAHAIALRDGSSLDALLPATRAAGMHATALLPASQAEWQRGYSSEVPLDAPESQQQGDIERRSSRPPLPPAAASGSSGAHKAPYRCRSVSQRDFDDQVVDFAERMFARNLDDEEDESEDVQEEADAEKEGQAASVNASSSSATEEAESAGDAGRLTSSSSSAEQRQADLELCEKKNLMRRAARSRKLAEAVARHKLFEAWLEERAKPVATFRAAAEKLGVDADPLLAHIHASQSTHLLWPRQEDSSQLEGEAALERAHSLLARLGLPPSRLAGVLHAVPQLLTWQPSDEAIARLQQLFGGRQELVAAVLRSPGLLLQDSGRVKRRLQWLQLQVHCSEAVAARMATAHPQLLSVKEEVISHNARFLGGLLPVRPFTTVISRFPALLTTPLQRNLSALQQRAPPELRRVDLTLVASQQPTLLLSRTSQVLANWRALQRSCEGVPEWRDELEALTQPMLTRDQLAGDEQHLAGASSGSGSPDGCDSQQQQGKEEEEQPFWFYRDEQGEAAAAEPGAFGTQQRPWLEADRLRARQLARLLDARSWQLQRLEFLAEQHPEEAGQQPLLDVVVMRKEDFAWDHPGFIDWLEARREAARQRWEEQQRQREEERQAAAAAAAVQAEAGEGGEVQAEAATQGSAAEASTCGIAAAAGPVEGSQLPPPAAAAAQQ